MDGFQNNRYRESDSWDDPRYTTDGSFTHPNFQFGHEKKINRFGEKDIRHDSYQDDQFKNDYDPTYKDEYGIRHPYEHGGEKNRWSDDIRSEASRENFFGRGPKGYQRSDEKIREEACEILMRDKSLDASGIEVTVTDRCIYLSGEVYTRKDKRLAEDLVDNIAGVEDVWNQLKINKDFEEHGFHIRPNERGDQPEGPVKGMT